MHLCGFLIHIHPSRWTDGDGLDHVSLSAAYIDRIRGEEGKRAQGALEARRLDVERGNLDVGQVVAGGWLTAEGKAHRLRDGAVMVIDTRREPITQPRLGPVGWARWAWRNLTSMRTLISTTT